MKQIDSAVGDGSRVGNDEVARAEVTFLSGAAPTGVPEGPSHAIAADKVNGGTTRIRGWFGRTGPEPAAG